MAELAEADRTMVTASCKSRWLAAVQLGLISSSFSTIVSQLAAARIGRDAGVDWMTVAAVPARDWMIGMEPSWGAILAGIAFHQWADLSWAVVFFGLLGRWTAYLTPIQILLAALPWAVLSSAMEWFVLVPLFPFFQPLFTLQQPYWIGLLVHASSAIMYPLFAWLWWPASDVPARDARFARGYATAAVIAIIGLSAAALASAAGHELPWAGGDLDTDQLYIRHMTTHHAQGIEVARLGAERARDPHLRALARLMVASQAGENRIFERWWQSWFETSMPDCTDEERSRMPGFLTALQLREVRDASSDAFDGVFVRLMTLHHKGAVKMADQEWRGRGDLRLRIMAHAIRHEQQGEIALMQGASGAPAVANAFRNMFADNVN
ncbi:DUF305 domain-containing protein [Bradyrhizobium sp. WSM 1704]|uniref:DUF305 domain-containing protein n=1 Tax=Bradyrhizobium semiaridum TaxID=2821404 RepID=UPI001CE2DF47|nr:DUF305 domain-containing protein [Bradyrhizobium semiaridum]MCA6125211.1 DUF305 domain-containing protein [Bradyrhizobium semiaridum]